MSTHCAIIALDWSGSYRGIYCHSDGYPEGVGETLRQHYRDFDKISALLDLGELSCVGEGPEREHGTIAYSRDTGEDLFPPHRGRTADEVATKIDHSGHVYVFEDGEWTHNGEPMDEPEDDGPGDGRRRWSGKDDETLPPGWEVKPATDMNDLYAVGPSDSILRWRHGAWMPAETEGGESFIMPGDWWMPMPVPPKDEP